MQLKPSEILRKAAALLERGWCQGAGARDRNGDRCHESSYEACSWCLWGAIDAAKNQLDYRQPTSPLARYMARAIDLNCGQFLAAWNDAPWRTQAEVVAACLRAAELAESEGQ